MEEEIIKIVDYSRQLINIVLYCESELGKMIQSIEEIVVDTKDKNGVEWP